MAEPKRLDLTSRVQDEELVCVGPFIRLHIKQALKNRSMAMMSGQPLMIWFIGSGVACILLLTWAAVASLGLGRVRSLALILLALTGALAVLPTGLGNLHRIYAFPFSAMLFIGASLCLLCAGIVLLKLRHHPELKRSAELGIAACLNLWAALLVNMSPLSNL